MLLHVNQRTKETQWKPFVARVVTVAAMIGLTPLPYLALWILMPFED